MKISTVLQSVVQRAMLNSLPRRYKGPRVSFAGTGQEAIGRAGSEEHAPAIHLSQPTESEFFAALERAEQEGFDLVCVYF